MEPDLNTIAPHNSPTGNDKIWAILAHVSLLVGVGIILPLVIYLAMRHESQYVTANAKEALNFHISLILYVLCCIPLVFILIGIPLAFVLGIGSLVLSIIASIKASEGSCYRYPLTIRFLG